MTPPSHPPLTPPSLTPLGPGMSVQHQRHQHDRIAQEHAGNALLPGHAHGHEAASEQVGADRHHQPHPERGHVQGGKGALRRQHRRQVGIDELRGRRRRVPRGNTAVVAACGCATRQAALPPPRGARCQGNASCLHVLPVCPPRTCGVAWRAPCLPARADRPPPHLRPNVGASVPQAPAAMQAATGGWWQGGGRPIGHWGLRRLIALHGAPPLERGSSAQCGAYTTGRACPPHPLLPAPAAAPAAAVGAGAAPRARRR